MDEVTPGSVNAEVPSDPNAVGAVTMEKAYADASAAVQPRDEAPPAQAEQPEVQPDQAPDASTDEGKFDVAEWKKSLSPDVAKNVDRVITSIRQKDSEDLKTLNERVQRLGWAEELGQLAASDNPQDRKRAEILLESTLNTLKKFSPQPEPDPLSGVDWETVEAVAPGLGALVQTQAKAIAELRGQVGEVSKTAQSITAQRDDAALSQTLKELADFAKKEGLPYNEVEVLKTADRFNLTSAADVRDAYWATYGPQLVEAGKQAAFRSLQDKKKAALPGPSPSTATPQRQKSDNMMDHWNHAKTEHGVSGSVV